MVSQTARRFNNSFLHKCIHSPHSIASHLVPTPRWQELGHTCLLQLLVPEPSEPHQNPKSPKPSKPSEPSKTHQPRNSKTFETAATFRTSEPSKPTTSETCKTAATFQTCGTQSLEPGTFARPHPGKQSRNRFPNLGTKEPVRTHRNLEPVPGTRFLPGTAPARPEHTEIYIVQIPHSILLLGKKYCVW